MAASWLLLAFAATETELYVARVIVGIAAAGAFALCSIYVRDIASDAIRGSLTALVMTFVTAGVLCSYILGWLASYRVAALVSAVGPLLFAAGFMTLPENPWFLLARGKTEEARQSLQWFRGGDDVEEELSSITAKIKLQRQLAEDEPVGLSDLFATRANRKAFLIAMVLCTNQHASGVFAMLTYTETIFREAGSSIEPSLSSIVVGAVLCAANYVSSLLVDRAGRRCLLLVSDVAVAAATAMLGAYFYAKNVHGPDMVSHLGWLPLVCLSVFVVGISLGLYPVPYVLLAELFAPRIRAMASSIGIAVTWLLPFVMAKFFPSMVAALGEHGCYWFFSACCIAGTVFIVVAVPETKGRSLDDIQRELQGGKYILPINSKQDRNLMNSI